MSKRYQAAILTASYNGLKVPNAPTIGTATSGGLSASVTFTAPSNIGGGAITSYTAISSPGGLTGSSASSPVTVSGLTSGVSYTFTVVANNVYGPSPASAASNSITAVDPSAFIENLFSTYLYTGNNTSQTITNGINLSGQGGLVWIKSRAGTYVREHYLYDTARGTILSLSTDTTGANVNNSPNGVSAYNSNGFDIVGSGGSGGNGSGTTYASWTFRKQPKFFDVVTWSGNGTIGRTISHSLGSEPGCIIVKKTNSSGSSDWVVYHRSLGATKAMILNLTDSVYTWSVWNDTAPTSTVFSLNDASEVNGVGNTYVAYLFAHNAGGFGTSGTDNVISCGSYTGTGGPVAVNLGYEPQWIMFKSATSADNWRINDVMRGMPTGGTTVNLAADLSNAEYGSDNRADVTSTGFIANGANSQSGVTHIYIAIRRGPMAVPTSGTSVFIPIATTASTGTKLTTNFPVDLSLTQERGGGGAYWMDKLRGALSPGRTGTTPYLQSSNTGAETLTTITNGWDNTGLNVAYFGGVPAVWWNWQRAPSFFDEVCYTGTGSATTVTHNLTVAPELMIVKQRNIGGYWMVYPVQLGNKYLVLQLTDAVANAFTGLWNNTAPTSSVFSLGTGSDCNQSGGTYVAYLFASCPGVSKVGSYSGTGATQAISCGFSGGARWVMIKRTDSTGDWFVWDTARGMVAGTDPRLPLNSVAAESNADWVYTATGGFQIVATDASVNAAGGTYIYLAIA